MFRQIYTCGSYILCLSNKCHSWHISFSEAITYVFTEAGWNAFVQAILGGTIKVPTLTGDVLLKVSPATQPGQKVVLKKKGIKTRNSYSFGDQYVHFNVSIPT